MPRPTARCGPPSRRTATLLLLLAALVHPAPAQAASLPGQEPVARRHLRHAMTARAPTSAAGSTGAAAASRSTSTSTTPRWPRHYDHGAAGRGDAAVRPKYAREHGVKLLFNTGRDPRHGRPRRPSARCGAAGYEVTRDLRPPARGETLTHSKQRCRQHFVAEGYTLVANVGNRQTDFTGGELRAGVPAAELRRPAGLTRRGCLGSETRSAVPGLVAGAAPGGGMGP